MSSKNNVEECVEQRTERFLKEYRFLAEDLLSFLRSEKATLGPDTQNILRAFDLLGQGNRIVKDGVIETLFYCLYTKFPAQQDAESLEV